MEIPPPTPPCSDSIRKSGIGDRLLAESCELSPIIVRGEIRGGALGQRIEIDSSTVIDNTTVFATDRSLTGTDGEGFASAEEASAGTTFPAKLAAEMFEADSDLVRVYIDQNALVVERSSGWPADAVAATSKVIEEFFLFYPGSED